MAMKILKRYTKEEVISELLEKCPILKYHIEDDIFYEMVYYGDLPLFPNEWEKTYTFIRLYYNTDTKSFYYNWICYVDMDDGYRSYAGLYQIKSKELCLTKNLEAFDLNCSYTENKSIEKEVKDSWVDKKIYDIHLKIKCKHKTIFECYTDQSDSYYPIGIIHDEVTKLELNYDNVAG